jgi:hypothetical protein
MGDNMTTKLFNTYNGKWSINDEAIHRGVNYANKNEEIIQTELRGISLHAILKNAYQEGFLHGFEHKFDEHNYEEKKDGNTL